MKVRIAVVVDSEGNWGSAGWKGDRTQILEAARGVIDDVTPVDDIEAIEKAFWVTVEIPIPEKEKQIEIKAKSVEEVT